MNANCLLQGMSIMANAMAVVEVARVDASLSTFLLVHSYLAMLTIGLLVSHRPLCSAPAATSAQVERCRSSPDLGG